MASSNAVPPSFGGTGNTGTGYAGANDAAGSTGAGAPTPAAPTSSIPAGATEANPGPVTTAAVPAPGAGYGIPAFQKIANQPVIEGGMAGASAATPAKPYDEKQLVQSLADTLNVKATKGETLEVAVVNELADKFGVKIGSKGTTTSGTGTGQGEVGQIRHNIASWFGTATNAVASAIVPGQAAKQTADATQSVDQEFEAKHAAAMKIKNPQLRQQAIKKLNQQKQQALDSNVVPQGGSPATPEPVQDENTKALNQIVGQVAQKLGVQGTGPDALENIAKSSQVDAQYEMPAGAATAGTPQTYAQNFQSFVAAWDKNAKLSNGQTFQQQWINNLENMGELNAASNTANLGSSQTVIKNGVSISTAAGQAKPTSNQVFNAYQNFLLESNTQGQSPLSYMQAAPNDPTNKALAAGAPSEMFGFVQGVAQEMGVGLTSDQLNKISNFYGASASVADDPSSVEDQIKDAVVALYSPPSDPSDPNSPNAYGVVNPSGVANTMFTGIQQQALSYQIPITAGQITTMVQNDLQGATVESVYAAADAAVAKAQQTFENQAKGLYPSLAAQISQGQTVQTLTSPYLNVAEAITGVPASTMTTDLQSGGVSKWGAFLQGGTNSAGASQDNNTSGKAEAGQPQMMTLDQWKTYLMQNPTYGFDKTQGGKDMGEQMSSAILNALGKINTDGGSSTPFNAYNGQSDLVTNTGGT